MSPAAEIKYRPELSQAGLTPTQSADACDEYRNQRAMQIAAEHPLTIYLDRHEVVTLMTLGTRPELLALGYLKNQGLVQNLEDIRSVQVDWDVNAAAVTTYSGATGWLDKIKNRTITTGCGQGTVFGDIMEKLVDIRLQPGIIRQSDLYALLKNLNAYNEVYKSAGAVHGCALCQGTGIMIFIEDVGRHNAVDAIAGHMWLEGIHGADKIFYTTGRLTSEMVIKVAQMGIPALLSRSGITRMGLDLARKTGVMMFSRAQGKHFLIYNGSEHVDFDVELPPKMSVPHLKTAE